MNIKYLGEQTISYLISKCKATFASIAHTHTASEIGADASGSASKALSNAKTYTDGQIEIVSGNLSTHTGNNTIHITSAERTKWNSKVDQTALDSLSNTVSGKANESHSHAISDVTNLQSSLNAKASQTSLDGHTGNTTVHITSTERTNWNKAKTHADSTHVTGVKGNAESSYRTGNVNITKANIGLGNVDNTSDANKPVSTAQQEAMDSLFAQAKKYADDKDALLLNNSSTAVDSIMELATAMAENEDVVDALEQAIGTKANSSDLTSHTSNKSNPHGVTKSQVGLGNVENKSSATIRGEITKSNVTTALGYTPYTQTEVDSLLDVKVDKVSGKGLSTNDYTTAEKTKLSGIAEGAEVNQNAFGKVTVGSSTITADAEIDTLTMVAGTGISLTADTSTDKVTITNSGVRSISTGSTNGTISVNTGGASANVAVKGLGSAAYTASTDYAKSSHGTHVTWSTTSPKMNGTATVGSETKVARGDHVHPTDTSRASQADLDALEEIVENHTHKYAGSSEVGGVATSAAKLATARKIGDTTFDGTADISLENIIGCGYCSSTSDTNQGKYQKFARINVSDAAWSGCFGTFIVKDVESNHINGQLNFHVRRLSTIATVSVNLTWLNVTTGYESSVVAVKVSDGIYDLYYKSVGVYETASFRLIDCKHRNKITLYGNQGWVDSVTVAATSALAGHVQIANVANKLNTNAGSATQPVYFSGGIPVACTNTLGKSVPSDAVFTDAKVTQTVRTTDGEFPILLRGTSAGTSTTTTGTTFGTKMTANPSTGTMTITSLKLGDATISYDTTKKAIVFNFE